MSASAIPPHSITQRYRTGDQLWVREHNLAILLNYIWEANGPISRSNLTETSGLNKSTVGSLLVQLQAWGFVKEVGIVNSGLGRPGVMIDINSDAGRIIGAEIGVDYISIVMTDLRANVVWRRKVDSSPDQGKQPQADILAQTAELVEEAVREAEKTGNRLLGIGLGLPGQVDHATGTLLFAPNLGWKNVPLRDLWLHQFNVPVLVENDANASALGERLLGNARQIDNFIFLSAGVGLGGGLVLDGELYGGAGGFAGEIGHMTLVPDGPQCNCGNRGCWETLIGPVAIVDSVRQAAILGKTPILMGLPGVNGDINAIRMEHILEAAARKESAVLHVLDEVGRYLGIGIASLVNAFNPSVIVLGGLLSPAGPYILPRAQQEVNARALAEARRMVKIILSAFKFDACVMGAACLVLREILNNPVAWRPDPAHNEPAANIR